MALLQPKREKKLADKVMNFALKYDFAKDFVFKKARGQVMKQTNGLYPAPLKVSSLSWIVVFGGWVAVGDDDLVIG